jgi:hypothetical protein
MPKLNAQRTAAIMLAVTLSLSGQLAQARKVSLATPCYDKLTNGAGPTTNDPANTPSLAKTSSADSTTASTTNSAAKNIVASANITPISLDSVSEAPHEDTSNTPAEASAPLLKSSISTIDYIPKGPLDPSSNSILIPSESIAGLSGGRKKKGEITIKQAASVNVMPIALMQSDDETKEKVETILDAEKKELADLWEATLTRSQDIQFVVQKLMPTSNAPHAATLLARTLSMCMFGGMGAAGALSPNMGTMYASQMGASMIMSVLGQVEGKAEKKAKISESESVMLYNMVRSTADKMVENYRDYKKSLASVTRANEDLIALHNMAGESGTPQEASHQLEMEYTLRKAQRDIEEKAADMRKYRQALQDLAGPDAIAKLDKQVLDEDTAVASQTQTSITADGQQPGVSVSATSQVGTDSLLQPDPNSKSPNTKGDDVQSEDAKASGQAGGRQTASTPGSQG